jgi:DivIVA domain-containing protein
MSSDVSPDAIESAEFSTALRGYDKDEVDAFLRLIGSEHRRLLESSRATRDNNEKPYQSLGADVGELLQHAKDAADGLRLKAEEDSARIREEAKKAAAGTRERVDKEAQKIREAAEYDASQRTKDTERRLEDLRGIETSITSQLDELRGRLQSVIDQLSGTAAAAAAATGASAPDDDVSSEKPTEGPVEKPAAAEAKEAEQRVIRIDAEAESSVS